MPTSWLARRLLATTWTSSIQIACWRCCHSVLTLGLNQLTTSVQQGSRLVMMSFVFAKQIVRALQRHQITGLAGVPTLWSLLAGSNVFGETRFPQLRYITNTGGALPLATLQTLRRTLTETRIFLMYGLTEAFRSTYLPPEQLDQRPRLNRPRHPEHTDHGR